MRANGSSNAYIGETTRTRDTMSYITWQTGAAIVLPTGVVRARGDASPQVRSPQRLAPLGDLAAQISHIRAVITEALAGVLIGMEPAPKDLDVRRDEIASLTLVAANGKLAAVGVALLDLQIVALENVSP